MARIDQSGDIIDGPVTIGGWTPTGACKISDLGYIYFTTNGNHVYCYDSLLNFINMVNHTEGDNPLSIDNVRQEILTDNTITRYGPTLNFLIERDVYGEMVKLTVDQNDGAIWYTDYIGAERGLYKIDHDFNPIYNLPYDGVTRFTDVSPAGSFWVENRENNTVQRRSSDGTVLAEGNIGDDIVSLAMYFNTESCWCVTWDTRAVVKVNSSGSIVYNNSADFNYPYDLDVDQSDGSAWIADTNNFEVVHLDSSGNELLRRTNNWTPYVVAVDPSDSTVIVLYQPGEVSIKSASLGEIKAMFAEPEK
jgi:DNA-binding beta-propeller fold protein YncE